MFFPLTSSPLISLSPQYHFKQVLTEHVTKPHYGFYINFYDSGWWVQIHWSWRPPETSLIHNFLCLSKPPPTSLSLPWVSPCPVCMGASLRFHSGNSRVCKPGSAYICKLLYLVLVQILLPYPPPHTQQRYNSSWIKGKKGGRNGGRVSGKEGNSLWTETPSCATCFPVPGLSG